MTINEYFGDWMKVLDKTEVVKIMKWLKIVNKDTLCPKTEDIFKAFRLCSLANCKAIFIFQDPYPQKDIATGIAIGNKKDTKNVSPSLEIIKNSVINLEIPHNLITFDITLESWENQGILLLNSALTTEVNKIGVHTIIWRKFMQTFLTNMSKYKTGIVYGLFGNCAQSLESFIGSNNYVLKEKHPAYYARNNQNMPNNIWKVTKELLFQLYGENIEYYKEEKF